MAKKSSGGGLTGLSVAELQAELSRRQKGAAALNRRRERLLAKLAAVEAQIDSIGGSIGGARRRPRNEMSLVEALAKALDGKTMSVTDVAQAVQRQGYRPSSPSFRTTSAPALISTHSVLSSVAMCST